MSAERGEMTCSNVTARSACLRTGSPDFLRDPAIFGLADYGVQARAAVPSLLQLTADPDALIRSLATNALLKITPEALTNHPVK